MASQNNDELAKQLEDHIRSLPEQQVRCRNCGRWLANEKILIGAFETKCKSCHTVTSFINLDLEFLKEILKKSSP